MKRLVRLVALLGIPAGLLLSGITNTSASATDTAIATNEVTTNVSQTDNRNSASMTITITMTPVSLPDQWQGARC